MRQSCGRISAWNICLQDACVEDNRTITVPLVRRCREHDRLLSSCFRIYTYEFVPDIKGDLVLNDVFIFVRLKLVHYMSFTVLHLTCELGTKYCQFR